ncbi:hypothetical protein TWF173_009121 [Orbilia oligospora]|nr:hypothetical protein TWF173_009121 [Orbilia oligospora]
MEKTPSEIHAQILHYLPSADVIGVLKALSSVVSGILNWNLTFFGFEHLLLIHRLLEGNEALVSPADGFAVRRKILRILLGEFQKIAEKVSKIFKIHGGDENVRICNDNEQYLEHSLFNCYFDEIVALVNCIKECGDEPQVEGVLTRQEEIINRFLIKYHARHQIVQEFCKTVAEVDPHGRTCRYDRIEPDQAILFKHQLFWQASDYILRPSGSTEPLSQAIIACRWRTFLHRIGTIFGPDTEASLRDCVLTKSVILMKYRDYTAAHASTNAYRNHQSFRNMLVNASLQVEDVSTFMLLQGLDVAYRFFHEEGEAINIATSQKAKDIRVCKNLWSNFEEVDLMS